MEGRVGKVGQVGGGAGAAAQRRADLLGGRDGEDGPLPCQQGGQEGGLGRGAKRGGDGERGGRRRGGVGGGFGPIPLLLVLYVLLSRGDGDGLEGRSVNYGWKRSSRARNRGMDLEE